MSSTSSYSVAELFSARGTRRATGTTTSLFANVTTIRRVTAYNYIKYRDEYCRLQGTLHRDNPEELKQLERKMLMIIPLSRISSSGLTQLEIETIQRRAMRGYCMYGSERYRELVRLRDGDSLLRDIITSISERP